MKVFGPPSHERRNVSRLRDRHAQWYAPRPQRLPCLEHPSDGLAGPRQGSTRHRGGVGPYHLRKERPHRGETPYITLADQTHHRGITVTDTAMDPTAHHGTPQSHDTCQRGGGLRILPAGSNAGTVIGDYHARRNDSGRFHRHPNNLRVLWG